MILPPGVCEYRLDTMHKPTNETKQVGYTISLRGSIEVTFVSTSHISRKTMCNVFLFYIDHALFNEP